MDKKTFDYFPVAVLFRVSDNRVINVYKTEHDVVQAYLCMPHNEELDWRVIDLNEIFQELMKCL